jgi:hypothetical protein
MRPIWTLLSLGRAGVGADRRRLRFDAGTALVQLAVAADEIAQQSQLVDAAALEHGSDFLPVA